MKKKLIACTLAMATVAATSVCTFAAGDITSIDGAATGQEITGTSTLQEPVIDITVPTDMNFFINPYGLTFTPDSQTPSVTSSDVIYSGDREIVSNSDVDILVNVDELKATIPESVTMSTKELTDKTTTKTMYMTMEINPGGADAKSIVIPGIAASDTKTKAAAQSGVAKLTANDTSKTDDDTKAVVKLSGSVVANPTKVDSDKKTVADPWTSSDAVTVSVKFTFTPQVVTTGGGE